MDKMDIEESSALSIRNSQILSVLIANDVQQEQQYKYDCDILINPSEIEKQKHAIQAQPYEKITFCISYKLQPSVMQIALKELLQVIPASTQSISIQFTITCGNETKSEGFYLEIIEGISEVLVDLLQVEKKKLVSLSFDLANLFLIELDANMINICSYNSIILEKKPKFLKIQASLLKLIKSWTHQPLRVATIHATLEKQLAKVISEPVFLIDLIKTIAPPPLGNNLSNLTIRISKQIRFTQPIFEQMMKSLAFLSKQQNTRVLIVKLASQCEYSTFLRLIKELNLIRQTYLKLCFYRYIGNTNSFLKFLITLPVPRSLSIYCQSTTDLNQEQVVQSDKSKWKFYDIDTIIIKLDKVPSNILDNMLPEQMSNVKGVYYQIDSTVNQNFPQFRAGTIINILDSSPLLANFVFSLRNMFLPIDEIKDMQRYFERAESLKSFHWKYEMQSKYFNLITKQNGMLLRPLFFEIVNFVRNNAQQEIYKILTDLVVSNFHLGLERFSSNPNETSKYNCVRYIGGLFEIHWDNVDSLQDTVKRVLIQEKLDEREKVMIESIEEESNQSWEEIRSKLNPDRLTPCKNIEINLNPRFNDINPSDLPQLFWDLDPRYYSSNILFELKNNRGINQDSSNLLNFYRILLPLDYQGCFNFKVSNNSYFKQSPSEVQFVISDKPRRIRNFSSARQPSNRTFRLDKIDTPELICYSDYIEQFGGIESLKIQANSLKYPDIIAKTISTHIPKVKKSLNLNFSQNKLLDTDMKFVGKIFTNVDPNITSIELDCSQNRIHNRGSISLFKKLNCLKKLETLKLILSQTQIKNKGLKALGAKISRLTKLRDLNIKCGNSKSKKSLQSDSIESLFQSIVVAKNLITMELSLTESCLIIDKHFMIKLTELLENLPKNLKVLELDLSKNTMVPDFLDASEGLDFQFPNSLEDIRIDLSNCQQQSSENSLIGLLNFMKRFKNVDPNKVKKLYLEFKQNPSNELRHSELKTFYKGYLQFLTEIVQIGFVEADLSLNGFNFLIEKNEFKFLIALAELPQYEEIKIAERFTRSIFKHVLTQVSPLLKIKNLDNKTIYNQTGSVEAINYFNPIPKQQSSNSGDEDEF